MIRPLPIKWRNRMIVRNYIFRAVGYFMIAAFSSFAGQRMDGIAAVVGDSIILQSEIDAYSLMRLSATERKPDSALLPELRKQFLNELIDGKILIVHAAKDTNIVLKETEIEQAQGNQIKMILSQNNITLPALEQELKAKYGMTLVKFKAQMSSQIREQLIRQKVQQLYVSGMQVNRKDVEAFFQAYRDSLPPMGESVRLSKLVIRIAPSDSIRQMAFAKISSIKQRLNNGEDFVTLAKQFSDDPNAENGGDLGFVKKGTLSEIAFEERAFALNPGQTSDIFQTRLGFHILSVIAKKDQMAHVRQIFIKVTPPEEVVQKIKTKLDSIKTHCPEQKDFLAAVREWSMDDQSKGSGGSMGWMALFEMPEGMRSVVDSLKQGDISAPVREGNDFAIYRLDERASQRKLTLEDDYSFLTEKTREITAQKKLFDLVKKWRREMFVEILL
jgi:peptidyl-prolyl cis-trans isomerase SurA